MKTNRQYNHLIDLEYFCHQDLDADNDELHLRDRNIFLTSQRELDNGREPTKRELIRRWLRERVQQEFPPPEHKSPGTIFGDTYLLARNLMVITGIFIGLAGGFSFFTYTGTTPVNVFHFLLFFVVSQLTLVGFLLGALLLRALWPGLTISSFYSLLLRRMIGKVARFFHKQWLQNLSTGKRSSVNQAFGILKASGTIYGSIFYWPVFALSQLFAIGFNIGLLAATLIKISTSDLAFGWQSTIQFSAEAIHRGVMLAASPWSWFIPEGKSYPTLAEIEGSRIILKEGIYHLSTENLISWWPFLLFCLLFYGLFFRLTLFLLGKLMESRSLHKLKLDTPPCLALIRRMQTPLVTTQAEPESKKSQPEGSPAVMHQPPSGAVPHLTAQVVLIPDDIYPLCPSEKLEPCLQQRGLTINEVHRFMVSYDQDQQLKELLSKRPWQPGEGIFILMEGWMVPLVDFLSYLKELRTILPAKSIIHLGLVGRPDTTVFTPTATKDLAIWRQKIEALGDPYLSLFSFIS